MRSGPQGAAGQGCGVPAGGCGMAGEGLWPRAGAPRRLASPSGVRGGGRSRLRQAECPRVGAT